MVCSHSLRLGEGLNALLCVCVTEDHTHRLFLGGLLGISFSFYDNFVVLKVNSVLKSIIIGACSFHAWKRLFMRYIVMTMSVKEQYVYDTIHTVCVCMSECVYARARLRVRVCVCVCVCV